MQVRDLQVVRVPVPSVDISINTVYKTSVVPFTNSPITEAVGSLSTAVVTEVQMVDETLPLTQVEVSTVTRNVFVTSVNSFTRTATNFITEVQTVPAFTTLRVTITEPQTRFLEVRSNVT